MVEKAIIDIISSNTKQGIPKEKIFKNLLDVGWEQEQIEQAYAFFTDTEIPLKSKAVSKSKKGLIKVLGIISIFLFFSSGALGYYYFFLSPTTVLDRMVLNISKIKTFDYSGELKAVGKLKDTLGGSSSIVGEITSDEKSTSNIYFSGEADISEIKEPKVLFTFDLTSDLLGEQMNLGLDLKVINKKVYINPERMGELLDSFGLSSLKGQWIEIDASSSTSESKINFDFTDLITKSGEILKITESLPSEDIKGVKSFYFSYEINKEVLKEYLKELASQNKAKEQDLTEIDHMFDNVESIQGELWVGKKDSFPSKLILNVIPKENTDSTEELSLILFISNINQPVIIDIPQNSKTFEEIIKENSDSLMNLF